MGHEKLHSTEHTDGTDDIQSASTSLKGLMTSTHATKLDKQTNGKHVGRQIYAHIIDVAIGTFLCGIVIPAELNGFNLTDVQASYGSAKGSSGTTDIQIIRWRSGAASDMLTTKITLGDQWTVSDESIDTNKDDVNTGDVIYFDVDTKRTGAKGLQVVLTFTKP